MCMPITFDDLRATGRYTIGDFRGIPVVSHDDDRWIVPVVAAARTEAIVQTPTLLVCLDRHHDGCNVQGGLGPLPEIRKTDPPAAELLAAVESRLSANDDDWIRAGMELGLFSDAVIWGVDPDGPHLPDDGAFTDHLGNEHRLFTSAELPGGQLAYQGRLSDLARREELQSYWSALGWKPGRGGWTFKDEMRCVLNIDLDCFVVRWQEFCWPWPEEVWEKRFYAAADYVRDQRLSTSTVLQDLLKHTALITIAREPIYTGGREKGRLIEEQLRRFLFEGDLDLPPYPGE